MYLSLLCSDLSELGAIPAGERYRGSQGKLWLPSLLNRVNVRANCARTNLNYRNDTERNRNTGKREAPNRGYSQEVLCIRESVQGSWIQAHSSRWAICVREGTNRVHRQERRTGILCRVRCEVGRKDLHRRSVSG